MDYVVFGIGFGATLLVLGLMIRDLGPRMRYRTPSSPDGVFHAEQLVARVAWVRFCGALGAVLAVAGVLFVLVTLICMALTIADTSAPLVMGISLGVLVLAVAFWTWAFFDRFGSYGILPEREVAPTPETVQQPVSAQRDRDQSTGVDPDQDEPAGVPAAPASLIGPPLPEPRVLTPEERLEAAGDPMEHGSAEVDLDTPSVTSRMHVRMGHATRLDEQRKEPMESDDPAKQLVPSVSDAPPIEPGRPATEDETEGTSESTRDGAASR